MITYRRLGDRSCIWYARSSIRCWVETPGRALTLFHGFANGESADMIVDARRATKISGTLKCLGQLKVYETDVSFGEDERGIGYYAAFLIEDVKILNDAD